MSHSVPTRVDHGITIPFYTDRDCSPEQIAALPVHGLAKNEASLCGYGLPGRWSDDRALWTCEECLAFPAQKPPPSPAVEICDCMDCSVAGEPTH